MTQQGTGVVARDWQYRYPGRADPALAHVSFTIGPGELVVLMGASGSGKSTLISALAGTLPEGESSGSLAVDGSPRIGLVQQEPEGNIVMELLGDDVAFPLENAAVPADEIWPQVARVLSRVGLDAPLGRSTAMLSGGQQQLLAIAAASAAAPTMLLLDEPTANLDPESAARVLDAVAEVRASTGCTVVVVEHRVEPWMARADRILLAVSGTIVGLDPDRVRQYVGTRPDVAATVWMDHLHLPVREPVGPVGDVVLAAEGVGVAGRLHPTSLLAHHGEIIALTGPPGAGKSTLLACLAGLMEPTTGSVTVDPRGEAREDPWHWPSAQIAATFGVVFQNPEHQFVTGRVLDELRHGLLGAGVEEPAASARASAMLDRLGLAHLAPADPFTLSGGEQRRLSVATALVLDPGILVLDEPTFGQDPSTWAALVDILAWHRDAGGTVVLATHDAGLVRALAAREIALQPAETAAADEQPRGRLRRMDPLALVGGAGLLSTAALVSNSIALNLGLALFSLLVAGIGGLPARRVALLASPAVLACASVAFSNALLSPEGLTSPQSWAAAALPASRVLAVALPGLVAAVALDPTALADALSVRLRVPARAAYAALAAFRLLPLLADEWAVLGRASRARGLGGSGPRRRARLFGSMAFRLLVAALRRGGRLAVALDARGLGPGGVRTVARPLGWSAADSGAIVAGLAALVLALATRG